MTNTGRFIRARVARLLVRLVVRPRSLALASALLA